MRGATDNHIYADRYGDIPVAKRSPGLGDAGLDGYLSYEWVKRWSRELAEPGVAFYQYINYMRSL